MSLYCKMRFARAPTTTPTYVILLQGISPGELRHRSECEKMADSTAGSQQPLQAPVPKPRPRKPRTAWTTEAVSESQMEPSATTAERHRGASESGKIILYTFVV